MVWIDNINQLEYYNPSGAPDGCYHDMLFTPNDLMLQASIFGIGINHDYAITIEALSTDGLVSYGDITSHFLYYFFGVNFIIGGFPVQSDYCNIKMNTVPVELCTHRCFILRVTITSTVNSFVHFDKWTQAYELDPAMCCVPVTGITVTQGGAVIGNDCSVDIDEPAVVASNPCGQKWLGIRVDFPCLDNNSFEFYGYPASNMIWPNQNYGYYAFKYQGFSWIQGELRENPREIVRTYAYNCTLQKMSFIRKYQLQGHRSFPNWKKIELENYFKSPQLYIGSTSIYQWKGGTMFERLHKKLQSFRLDMVVEECEKRQIFGCYDIDKCTPSALHFAFRTASTTGRYFDDARNPIANDFAGLVTYLKQVNGVTDVEEVTIPAGEALCSFYKVLKVSGNIAKVPTLLYSGYQYAANRVYAKTLSVNEAGNVDYNALCNGVHDALYLTPPPVLDTPVVVDVTVPAPVLDTPVLEDMTVLHPAVTGFGDWTASPICLCTVIGNTVTLTVGVANPLYNNPPALGKHMLLMEQIASVAAAGAPVSGALVDSTTNPLIPAGRSIQIDPSGAIYWTGETITEDDIVGATIEFISITYSKI